MPLLGTFDHRRGLLSHLFRRGGAESWNEPWNGLPVIEVLVAEMGDEIAFLEERGQAHIHREYGSEQQMAHGHRRRRPEDERPTDIEGVSHAGVEKRRAKSERFVRP